MKKLLTLLSPLVLVLVTACGGGDEAPPPQALKSDAPPEARAEMMDAANRMKHSCSGGYAPFFTQQAQMASNPQMAAMMAMQPQPDGGNCGNDAMNLMMIWSTFYKEEANEPAPREWLMSQFKGVLSRIEMQMRAQGIRVTPQLLVSMAGSIKSTSSSLLNRLGGAPVNSATQSYLAGQGSSALGGLAAY